MTDIFSIKPLIIAEVAQAHEGSVGLAHSFIEAAADAGADAVKFQTHMAGAESTLDEPFRIRMSSQDATRYDYWKRMEFTVEQWHEFKAHCDERGVLFLSSPFSLEAVELLGSVGVAAWKIGSGEIYSRDMLSAVAQRPEPVLLSSGMSPWVHLDKAVQLLQQENSQFAVFQCTSKYPTPFSEVGLNVLSELRARYECPVGLSDHSGTPFPAIAAMALGCELIEAHVTFDRKMYGPDAVASVEFEELALMCRARDAIRDMLAHPLDKDAIADDLADMRAKFGKSLAPREALAAGTRLERDMLTLKKPATGIPAAEIDKVVGRVLVNPVQPDRLLKWKDLND